MSTGPRKRSPEAVARERNRIALGKEAMSLPIPQRRARIRELVAIEANEFMLRRKDKIQKLKLKDLNLNPFLLRLVGEIHSIETPAQLVSYLVDASLHAGHETAYGWFVDLFLPPYFGASTPIEREDFDKWEAYKEIDKEAVKPNPGSGEPKRHLISVKAGPLTINDTMARRMHANVRGFVEYGSDPVVYGVTYGRREQLSNKPAIVKGPYGDDRVAILVGREFWEWLAQYEGAHEDIYKGIAEGVGQFSAEQGEPIHVTLARKKDELTKEVRELFQIGSTDDMWQRLMETGF